MGLFGWKNHEKTIGFEGKSPCGGFALLNSALCCAYMRLLRNNQNLFFHIFRDSFSSFEIIINNCFFFFVFSNMAPRMVLLLTLNTGTSNVQTWRHKNFHWKKIQPRVNVVKVPITNSFFFLFSSTLLAIQRNKKERTFPHFTVRLRYATSNDVTLKNVTKTPPPIVYIFSQ